MHELWLDQRLQLGNLLPENHHRVPTKEGTRFVFSNRQHIYSVGAYSSFRSRMRLRVKVIRQRVLALGSSDPGCLIVPMS